MSRRCPQSGCGAGCSVTESPPTRAAAPRPAAFVDRDGVINEERGYVHRIEDFRLLPGAVDGLRALHDGGFRLVVVTNQAGIARGLYGEDDYRALTRHMAALLRREGVTLDAVYHCPHHPSAGRDGLGIDCTCRKPSPGMLLRARDELALDLGRSVMIGDKRSDLEAGRAAGVGRLILVESGHVLDASDRSAADFVCTDLLEAACHVVAGRSTLA
jgi:D-glycero-D-manno-heptose 1,7-bisphosphate phosphatase